MSKKSLSEEIQDIRDGIRMLFADFFISIAIRVSPNNNDGIRLLMALKEYYEKELNNGN